LDYPDRASALAMVAQLAPARCRLKVGKELFTRCGPSLVEDLVGRGFDVFLDLKFHDIPNTVARAVAVAADLGVWMVNVHALGGRAMLSAAQEALTSGPNRPLLIGVTVLTSMDTAGLQEVGIHAQPQEEVARLATLVQECGLDGVVCSPQEVALLRRTCGEAFKLVTPGVRPAGTAVGDQKRVMTPADAVRAGSDYLVIGRPITQAPDPMAALVAIEQELAGGDDD
jgi:orotidine-5'-phosphate decarboxylase